MFWYCCMNYVCIISYFYKLCQGGFFFLVCWIIFPVFSFPGKCHKLFFGILLHLYFSLPTLPPPQKKKRMKEKEKALIDLLPVNLWKVLLKISDWMAGIPVRIQLRTIADVISKGLWLFDGFPKALRMLGFLENFSSDRKENVISVFLVWRDKFDNMTRAECVLKAMEIKH